MKRLEAIAAIEERGVGFTLASRDLEIRRRQILGEELSGSIEEIGCGSTLDSWSGRGNAQGGAPARARSAARSRYLDRAAPAGIDPEDYLPDEHTRLLLYKRIARASRPFTRSSTASRPRDAA